MSRHRNVRSMNYTDEYDGYDDVYGHSVEDDSCISPSDAAQFIYDRARGTQGMSGYFSAQKDIQEEDEGECDEKTGKERRDSVNFKLPDLNELDLARLNSCMDEIRNVIGDSVSEKVLVETILQYDFDVAKSLDAVLDNSSNDTKTEGIEQRETLNKGLIHKVASKFTSPLDLDSPSITVVKAPQVTKGFDVLKTQEILRANQGNFSSPRSQSPASGNSTPSYVETSGRNTPVNTAGLNTPSASGRNTPTNNSNDVTTKNIEEILKAPRQKESKYDPTQQYSKERGSSKEHLHMIVIGHVDAGKSTLMGHLLCAVGQVSQRTMHKYEQESKKLGKQSFMYAWVLDETGEERARGITMDVGFSQFETASKQVTILDAPGHKDFIPNMISGAGQADVALLVVDATRGEFESGFDLGGQTREHALLVRSLGVNQLAVVVNKLDTVNWSEERFLEITNKLKSFLKQAGFRDNDVTYIPCSGLTGENLVSEPTEDRLKEWYKGPNLVSVIDNFKTPERPITKPFRMSVNDIFKGTGSGFCISGRVETGTLNVGDRILVCPIKEIAQVKAISIDDMSRSVVFAGDQVAVTLSGVDMQNVAVGYILSDINNPVPVGMIFECRIVVFNVRVPITKGFPVILHHQSLIEPANIIKLIAQLHKNTGEVVKKKPRCLGNNSSAIVEIQVSRPICLERYRDVKELGRVMLRVGGVTIAAGLITDIKQQ